MGCPERTVWLTAEQAWELSRALRRALLDKPTHQRRPGRTAARSGAAQTRDPERLAQKQWTPDLRRIVPLRFTLRRVRGTG
jgi:hypothetical protein